MKKRRCPKIQTCPSCGEMRANHPGGLDDCPVPPRVTARLVEFALNVGPRWKAALVRRWERGDEDTLLRQARNLIGPTNLYKIGVSKVLRAAKEVMP